MAVITTNNDTGEKMARWFIRDSEIKSTPHDYAADYANERICIDYCFRYCQHMFISCNGG